MTPELTVLALASLLQAVQFAAYSISAQRQVGAQYAAGPRDEPLHLTGMAGRLQRALNNHFEALILFTIAVVLVSLADKSSGLTRSLAWAYLGARLLYVPAYAFGLSPWRSLIWFVGFLATCAMIVATLV